MLPMNKKTNPKRPKVTPEFEQAIKALANSPPINNKELVKRNKTKK